MRDLCAIRTDPETVARYVAGTLEGDAVATFEVHLLECRTCEAAVREHATVAAGVRRTAIPGASRPAIIGERTRRRAVATLLSVAGIAAVGVLMTRPGADFRDLDDITPPTFESLSMRAGGAASAASGMDAYSRRDYAGAAAQLDESARRLPEPGTFFFLGISHLMLDDSERARGALESALLPRPNPYSAEAHFYLAKLFLRRGTPDSALAHLERIPVDSTAISRHARTLTDSVRARYTP